MNWIKDQNISSYVNREHLLIVYGTNKLVNSLPIPNLITDGESAYSDRLKGEGQKDTWRSCRAVLRMILGSYLNKDPKALEFRKGSFGKLSLPKKNPCFNISHSQNAFLLGFNPGGAIGVDIEKLNGSEDVPALVNYAFSSDEINYFREQVSQERFTQIWTLKEAFLKVAGVGLIDKLSSITVTGKSPDIISCFHLNQHSFLCPGGETGSIVYRQNKPLTFLRLD